MRNNILLILFGCLITANTYGRVTDADTAGGKIEPPLKRFYVGTGLDGAIFSSATIKQTIQNGTLSPTVNNSSGTLRFSLFINTGFTFNFNLSKHLGVYTGIDLKNIGYIDKNNYGETVKRRTYNLGAPIGVKIGNMHPKKMYVFLGGGADIPVNYKQKSFSQRNQKTKLNEWFSQRTPLVMPYLFAGVAMNHGYTIKAQYYTNNYMNPDFSTNGTKPYAGADVHIIMISLGYAMPVKDHSMMKHMKEMKENKVPSLSTL